MSRITARARVSIAELPRDQDASVRAEDQGMGALACEAVRLLAPTRPAEPAAALVGPEGGPTTALSNGRIAVLAARLADEERDARVLEALDDAGRRALAPALAKVRDMAAVVSELLAMRDEASAVERALRSAR